VRCDADRLKRIANSAEGEIVEYGRHQDNKLRDAFMGTGVAGAGAGAAAWHRETSRYLHSSRVHARLISECFRLLRSDECLKRTRDVGCRMSLAFEDLAPSGDMWGRVKVIETGLSRGILNRRYRMVKIVVRNVVDTRYTRHRNCNCCRVRIQFS
jgi:hypothetical protein